MGVNRKSQTAYGVGSPFIKIFNDPIISKIAPKSKNRAEIGTVWCQEDQSGGDNIYILSSIVAGKSNWISVGGGTGTFNAVVVNPGNLTVSAGNFEVTAGVVKFGAMGFGVLTSDASGVISSTTGTDGQIMIMGTGVAPAAATLTAGTGITITNASNAITIAAPEATATRDTSATDTVTVNALVGAAIYTGFTTASSGTQQFTVTNNECSTTSLILTSVSNLGSNDALMNILRVTPGAGYFTVDVYNSGSQALNGDLTIVFRIYEV